MGNFLESLLVWTEIAKMVPHIEFDQICYALSFRVVSSLTFKFSGISIKLVVCHADEGGGGGGVEGRISPYSCVSPP